MYIAQLLLPHLTMFASEASACSKSFLGLKTWFAYFPDSWFGPNATQTGISACSINNNFVFMNQNGQSGLLLILLAVLDDLIRIAALVAVGYVVYGGIQFVTSQGSPDATSKAQQTVINALIGLVFAIISAALVSFIGNKLGGS